MAKAIDGSGAVDQANMHACNGNNIIDLSFLNFPTDKPPGKAVSPTPEIQPGSHTARSDHEPHTPGGTIVDVGLAVSPKNRGPRLRGAARSRTLQEGPFFVQLLVF